jgi:hypothetical protein
VAVNDRIFVSVAAYRDAELARTVRDLFGQAARPSRLTVAVLDQNEQETPLPDLPRGAKVVYERIHPTESRGACWARARVQSKMGSEGYFLQLDSHHVFKRGWDKILHEQFAACPSDNPVLTAYLPPYEPVEGGGLKINAAASTPMHFSHFDNDGIVIYRAYSYAEEPILPPQPARFFSGHFAFGRRDFVERVPYDPELYFYGEESTLAARAFTHGYDLFHPGRTIAWHHYTRQGRPRHWDPESKGGLNGGTWVSMQRQGVSKYRRIFCMLPHVSAKDGLGTKRRLHDYEAWAGVDHYWQVTHKRTSDKRPPPAALAPDWTVAEGLLQRRALHMELPPLTTIDPRESRQVHVAVMDATPRDGAALRVSPAEYEALRKTGWKVNARYRSGPLRLVVWPLLEKEKEWGNKHEVELDLQTVTATPVQDSSAKTPRRSASARRKDRSRKKGA